VAHPPGVAQGAARAGDPGRSGTAPGGVSGRPRGGGRWRGLGRQRYLTVIADDYGIGPETSRGILDLARRGAVTGTVLLAHTPHAEADVAAWRRAGSRAELGWHPCLTLDAPVLPAGRGPPRVGARGRVLGPGPVVSPPPAGA